MTSNPQLALAQLTDQEQRTAAAFVNKVRTRFDPQLISVVLFGSRARGEAKTDSDMDVVVVMTTVNTEIRQAIRHLAVEVWLESGIYLSTRVWSQEHWRNMAKLQTSLYQNISQEGIELFHATPA